jgi:hypothetical protein
MEKGGVIYTNSREKKFRNAVPACFPLRKKLWKGVTVRSIKKIPLLLTGFYQHGSINT